MESEAPKKQKTPEEKLRAKLRFYIRQYRIAVRWLRDAKNYQRSYASELTFEGKNWKDSAEGELAKDAQLAYKEAVAGVLHWRRLINESNKSLAKLTKEKVGAGKRVCG